MPAFAGTNGEYVDKLEPALSRRTGPQMLNQLARIGRQLAEAPDADGELAHRPSVRQLDDRDRHGALNAPRRAFRHNADADIALDQPAHRVEAAQLHAQPQ